MYDGYDEYEGYYDNASKYYNNKNNIGFMKSKTARPDYRNQPLKRVIPMNVSSKVLKQIKFLTSRISSVEWSGVLFYSVTDDIDLPSKFQITLEYIFLMDKGTGGSTEYDYDEELIDFRIENPESLEWKIGHIHSHNSMGTYFSTTDTEELEDNVKFHNYYLSVIVNNALDIDGKIAFLGKLEDGVMPYECKTGEGKSYKLEITAKEEDIMFIYDCQIYTEEIIMEDSFVDRLKIVVDREANKQFQPSINKVHTAGNFTSHIPAKDKKDKPKRGRGRPSKKQKQEDAERDAIRQAKKDVETVDGGFWMDDFPAYWLQFGNMATEFDFTIDALENIRDKMTKINKSRYIALLIVNSVTLYEKYFPNTEIDMVEVYSQVYNSLLENIDLYEYVGDILDALDPFIAELSKMKLKLIDAKEK